MIHALLADLTVLLHFAFILFVLGEWVGWICPLTPLENHFRALAGESAYAGGFVAQYLLPLIYPAGLTPTVQLWLGAIVVLLNAVIYTVVFRRVGRKDQSKT